MDALAKNIEINNKGADKAYLTAQNGYANSRIFVVTVIIATLLVGVLLALIVSRITGKGLAQGLGVAEKLARGDLSVSIEETSKDEAGQLLAAMQTMIESIRALDAEQMAQGASEQSAAVEQISSSMEEMAANVNQNAENAQQTEQIALKAAEDAKEGGRAVAETVDAMQQIAGKISIIEEIRPADQSSGPECRHRSRPGG